MHHLNLSFQSPSQLRRRLLDAVQAMRAGRRLYQVGIITATDLARLNRELARQVDAIHLLFGS